MEQVVYKKNANDEMKIIETPFGTYFTIQELEDSHEDCSQLYTFIVDRSYSMEGERLSYVKELLYKLLDKWKGKRELLTFHTRADSIKDFFNKEDVDMVECYGGTTFCEAFEALDSKERVVFFITDGGSTMYDVDQTVKIFKKKNIQQLHAICLGDNSGVEVLLHLTKCCEQGSVSMMVINDFTKVFDILHLLKNKVHVETVGEVYRGWFYEYTNTAAAPNIEFKDLPVFDQINFLKMQLSKIIYSFQADISEFKNKMKACTENPIVIEQINKEIDDIYESMEKQVINVVQKGLELNYKPNKKIKYVERRKLVPSKKSIYRLCGKNLKITKIAEDGILKGIQCVLSHLSASEAHNQGDVLCMCVNYVTHHQASYFHPYLVTVRPQPFFMTLKNFNNAVFHCDTNTLDAVPNLGDFNINGVLPLYVNDTQWNELGRLFLEDCCSTMASGVPGEGDFRLAAKIIPLSAWIDLYLTDKCWAADYCNLLKSVVLQTWVNYEDVNFYKNYQPPAIKAGRLALENKLTKEHIYQFAVEYFVKQKHYLRKCILKIKRKDDEHELHDILKSWMKRSSFIPPKNVNVEWVQKESRIINYFDTVIKPIWNTSIVGRIFNKNNLQLDIDKLKFVYEIDVITTSKERIISKWVEEFLSTTSNNIMELAAIYNLMSDYDIATVRKRMKSCFDYPNYKKKLTVGKGFVMKDTYGKFVHVNHGTIIDFCL